MAESQKTSSTGLRAEDCFSKELRALVLMVTAVSSGAEM